MTGQPPIDDETAEHDAWFRAEVERGLREADDPATQWISHDQAIGEMQRLLELRIAEALAREGGS